MVTSVSIKRHIFTEIVVNEAEVRLSVLENSLVVDLHIPALAQPPADRLSQTRSKNNCL